MERTRVAAGFLAAAFFVAVPFAPARAAGTAPKHRVRDNAQWALNFNQGNDAVQSNNLTLAEIKFKAALKVAEAMERDDPKGVAVTLWSLANVELALREESAAESHFSRSLALEEKAEDSDEQQMAEHFRAVGNFYMQQQKYAKARVVYDRAVDHAKAAQEQLGHDPDYRDMAANHMALATATLKSGDYAAAEPVFEKAKAIYEKVPGGIENDEDRRFILRALLGEADSYAGMKKFDTAEPIYQRVLALDEKAFGKKDPKLADACDAYAKMLRAAKRVDEAKKIEAKAKDARTPEKAPFQP
ncbi:MAG TPA: tetratricopeptide repeat protein [bacterium]|nr:tetratricopeptide repeat protein [bacterium]